MAFARGRTCSRWPRSARSWACPRNESGRCRRRPSASFAQPCSASREPLWVWRPVRSIGPQTGAVRLRRSPAFSIPPQGGRMLRFGLAVFVSLLSVPAFACSVPVFRYALEQWPPSRYRTRRLSPRRTLQSDRATCSKIADAARPRERQRSSAVDLERGTGSKAVWDREGKGIRLPRLLLRYPDSEPEVAERVVGPLAIEPVVALFDFASAARHVRPADLGQRGGRPAALERRRSLPTRRPARSCRGSARASPARIELPRGRTTGRRSSPTLPLRVAFPVVEVRTRAARGRPRPHAARQRGRAGRGARTDRLPGVRPRPGTVQPARQGPGEAGELQRSLEFLCRACSCQVKELNPGVDLLMTGNWDTIFDAETGPTLASFRDTPAGREPPRSAGPIGRSRGPPRRRATRPLK